MRHLRFILSAAIAVLSVSAVSAQTFFIDKFSDPQVPTSFSITTGSTGPTNQAITALGSDIFTRRAYTMTYLAGSGANYTLGWDGSTMTSSGDTNVRGTFTDVYSLGGSNANFNATGTNSISFDLLILDFSQKVDITISSNGVNATVTGVNVISTILNGGPYTLNIPFSSFTGAVTPSDIDQITFTITDQSINTQLQYDNLRLTNVAVPEPATIAFLGLASAGAAGGWYIRRRRNQKNLNAKLSRI
ncbi:MAG TPA: PEP-CTERM sorting domain-containing protein [Gemmatales bacterium]|nr:PEP-CTERM sorting domain-containing protein [Gemmatales bacterium]